MTLATLRDVLKADRAIAGLVVLGWEDARGYVEAAEETGIPIILQAGPGARKYMPVEIWGKMFRHLAEHASVPIVCHLDHAYTLAECAAAIDAGFTSVMIDGSRLPIAENISLTQKVVALAKRASVSVEGEVGEVGYVMGAASAMTLPDEAALFDRESGADALAISIGNVHLNTEKTNGIDWAVLKAIEAVTRLPLVLHGGSGIPLDVRRELALESRVSKFNFGTELRMTFGKALRKSLKDQPDSFDRIALLTPTIAALKAESVIMIKNIY